MKRIVILTIIVTIGCIMAAGCVAQPKKDLNITVTPTITFSPFNNTTNSSGPNGTFNASNVTNVTILKGPLRISISNYIANLSVSIDNQTVGYVSTAKPLDLMVNEGNHSVKVCVGLICETEDVNILFAKRTFIDFGERLKRDVEFSEPTTRIIDYYREGDGVIAVVEFINPSADDLFMTVEVGMGYSYISGRTDQRVGDSVRNKGYSDVPAGRRTTERVELVFADGIAYIFDPPYLGKVTQNKI